MFDRYLKTVMEGNTLGVEEAYLTAKMLLHDDISAVKAAAFLGALRTRKEQAAELSGFVQALYEEALTLDTDLELLDTCGTGGDGLGTFNISTAAALVVAGCGIPVAKHGNRAMTGKVGSADVLAAMGVNIMLSPDEARRVLDKAGITFLFAQHYHPIMKQVGGLRRDIGVATIFNFLGPMLNPFPLAYQVMGVADGSLQGAVSETLDKLGRKKALVIHAENGMDEVSPCCATRIYETANGDSRIYDIHPQEVGVSPISLEDIKGGELAESTTIFSGILDGKPGPYRETVVLNAGLAIVAAERAGNLEEGMALAREAIDSGRAKETLKRLIQYSRDGVAAC